MAGLAKLDLDPGAGPDALRANLLLALALLEATSARKQVVFSYRPPGREAAERRLDPYALVNRRGTWYVVGHDADREALRSFRVSRIASDIRKVRPTSRGPDFEVPAGFDPGKVLPTAGEPEGRRWRWSSGPTATARSAWSPCACPSATATACSAGRWATASRSSSPPTCATRPARSLEALRELVR